MWRGLAVMLACLLTGCSFAPIIEADAVDYDQTYEDVANHLLVTNILRARDRAPLYFSNISLIHASIQGTASAGVTFPFGPLLKSTQRGAGVGAVSIQTAPSFDIAPLNTQDFTQGILKPIDPLTVKYYFDRALSQKMLVYLFFSRIKRAVPTSTSAATDAGDLLNDPTDPEKFREFVSFVDKVFEGARDGAPVIQANQVQPLHPVGPPFKVDMAQGLRGLLQADPMKYRLIYRRESGEAQLYSVGPQEVFFCRGLTPLPMVGLPSLADIPISTAIDSQVASAQMKTLRRNLAQIADVEKQVCTSRSAEFHGEATPTYFGSIYMRSAEGIIQYLGALARSKEFEQLQRDHIGFTLVSFGDSPDGARFGVEYKGRTYYVRSPTDGSDRTLEVLALLTQLLNLSKVAKEIPTTKAVEIVP